MIHARPCFSSFLPTLSLIGAFCAPVALASHNSGDREVRIGTVSGDVRLSPGDGKRPDFNRPWELAQRGDLVEQGASIATVNGRAEIEFEDGSTAYLAEKSLLSFSEISSGNKVITRMSLLTGSATFSLRPVPTEHFFIVTPTDQLEITPPSTFFARVNSYLNVTAITFQGGVPGDLFREGRDDVHVNSGQSSASQGELVAPRGAIEASRPAPVAAADAAPHEFAVVNGKSAVAIYAPTLTAEDFDQWVAAREAEKKSVLAAALRASGLASPIPGLRDLYSHGSFFTCEPYGTCWEPSTRETAPASFRGPAMAQSSAPTADASTSHAQSTNSQTAGPAFQPTTVVIAETVWGACGTYSVHRVSHLASTQAELDQLLELKTRVESAQNQNLLRNGWSRQWCYDQPWIPRGRQYAMVVHRPICAPGKKCPPIHPPHPHPHPVFARVAGKIAFVPRNPGDSKWRAPLNAKNGVLFLPIKPGEPSSRTVLPASEKLAFLKDPGRELDRTLASAPQAVSAPEIRAQLWHPSNSAVTASAAGKDNGPQISYNYKMRAFTVRDPGSAKSKEVVVARANSAGSVHTESARGSSSSFNPAGSRSASSSSASRSANSASNSGSRSSAGSSSNSASSSSRSSSAGSASSYSPSPSSSASASSSASSGGGSHPH